MTKPTLRGWATPLVIGAFFLMAGTGVVMFFRFDNGLMAPIHRLFSWIFLVGAIGHVTANIRPFKGHLKSTLGRASALVFGTLLIVSLFSWGRMTTPKLYTALETTMAGASISTLAAMTHLAPETVVQGLRQSAIAATPDQTIHQIAAANKVSDERVLGIVVALPAQRPVPSAAAR